MRHCKREKHAFKGVPWVQELSSTHNSFPRVLNKVSATATPKFKPHTDYYICTMTPLREFFSMIAFLVLCSYSIAQSDSIPSSIGKVTFVADSTIVNLEKGSRRFKEIKGYRIQIFLGPLEQVKIERNKYLALGLPHSAYIKQIVPEHALQIGDFTSRMEMEKCLRELEISYPRAFGVVEIIEPPKYNKKPKNSR